jgi:DNA (cytosine-5)-methyltransferase 1
LNELSLFSGAGGGLLASRLLGWRTIGYVEFNNYCQRVIAARIKDGYLDEAPIFGDIRAFNDQGYAERYRGMVDVVSAGFPCQAFSTAARGRNKASRDLWPETYDVIRVINPGFVFLENVAERATFRARGDLTALGYLCLRGRVSAAALGAPIRRVREWLLAITDSCGEPSGTVNEEAQVMRRVPRLDAWDEDISSDLGMAHGLAHRLDRLRALGNGQVPAVAATAWRLLTNA